ncbi:hypothetical protein VNO80_23886 [Phaseolus coccineus]|uniref:Uncharacterized protein n=1 Tax=Phaseolus coccineus TaxID=3886 RepID=A0AAN9M9Z4_PHACN
MLKILDLNIMYILSVALRSIIDRLYQEKLRLEFHKNEPYLNQVEPSENTENSMDMPEQAGDTDMPEQAEDTGHEIKEATTVDNHVAENMPPENSAEDVTMVDKSDGVAKEETGVGAAE